MRTRWEWECSCSFGHLLLRKDRQCQRKEVTVIVAFSDLSSFRTGLLARGFNNWEINSNDHDMLLNIIQKTVVLLIKSSIAIEGEFGFFLV